MINQMLTEAKFCDEANVTLYLAMRAMGTAVP